MAINFVQGQVAVGDPNPGGPSVTSNVKDVRVKIVKITGVNFNTTPVNTLVAVLPADASILDIQFSVKAQLAGGGITAATMSIGSTSAGSQYTAAYNAFGTAGVNVDIAPLNSVMQNYQAPLGPDLPIWVQGTATTGNPTSGEIYLSIYYVR